MAKTNPNFWAELTIGEADDVQLPDVIETLPKDVQPNTELKDQDADDSDLPLQTLITALMKNIPETVCTQKSGKLELATDAENVDLVLGMPLPVEANVKKGNDVPEGSG